MKTFKIILVTILLSSGVACASTANTNQQQNSYSSYKLCDHVSPSKVSKCVK